MATFDWDFGDGQTARGPVIDPTLASAGNFTVRLKVRDADMAQAVIAVAAPAVDGHEVVSKWAAQAR